MSEAGAGSRAARTSSALTCGELEATFNFVVRASRMLAEILGKLLFCCRGDKIV